MTNTKIQLPSDMTTEEYNILMEICKGMPCESLIERRNKSIIHNKINQTYIDSVINECWN